MLQLQILFSERQQPSFNRSKNILEINSDKVQGAITSDKI